MHPCTAQVQECFKRRSLIMAVAYLAPFGTLLGLAVGAMAGLGPIASSIKQHGSKVICGTVRCILGEGGQCHGQDEALVSEGKCESCRLAKGRKENCAGRGN
eukprot:1147666-Pelagomonas_calceolata.AAC.16